MRATQEVEEVRLLAALDEDVRLKFSLNKDVDEDKRHLHCFRVIDVRWEGGLQLLSFDQGVDHDKDVNED